MTSLEDRNVGTRGRREFVLDCKEILCGILDSVNTKNALLYINERGNTHVIYLFFDSK